MKVSLKILLAFFVFITATSCKAQLVQKIDDAKKLEINEKQFFNKPLKNLLKEIKPKIERVLVSPGRGETNSFFVFYFIDEKEYDNYKNEGKKPVSIRVYTNENIDWDIAERPKEDRWRWSESDIKKYGNLTVAAIRVSGKD